MTADMQLEWFTKDKSAQEYSDREDTPGSLVLAPEHSSLASGTEVSLVSGQLPAQLCPLFSNLKAEGGVSLRLCKI